MDLWQEWFWSHPVGFLIPVCIGLAWYGLRMLLVADPVEEDNAELDAINEPNLNVEAIEIPEEGDFEYEFDVEVRPEFELPEYTGLTIDKPVREISDEDVADYEQRFLSQYGDLETHDGPAEKGEYVEASFVFHHGEQMLGRWSHDIVRLQPTLRFQDAELTGFGMNP